MLTQIDKIQQCLFAARNELTLGGYSCRTVKSYIGCLKNYFEYIEQSGGDLKICDLVMIKGFLINLTERQSSSSVNLHLSAIKFFYQKVLKCRKKIIFRFLKRRKRLPVVLSKEEIKKCLDVLANKKHRLIVALAYGGGLRVSEVVNLKVCDLDLKRDSLHVRNSKGGRDRITLLPAFLKDDIRNEIISKKGDVISIRNKYLFESQRGGKLTSTTAQKVFKASLNKAGVLKDATFHSLRHSFATHLLEDGVNLGYIQKLLGHRDIKTTLVYTQVTDRGLLGVRSPLDGFGI